MATPRLQGGSLARYSRCIAAPCCVTRRGAARKRARVTRCAAAGRDGSAPLPQIWSEVVGWAKREFEREVLLPKPDAQINLGRACLLIALEEEASIEMHPELESQLRDMPIRFRSMGSASTWSLERMDSLAAEVMSVFLRDMAEGGDVQQQRQQEQQPPNDASTCVPLSAPPDVLVSRTDGSPQEPAGPSQELAEACKEAAEEFPRDLGGSPSGQPEALAQQPGGSSHDSEEGPQGLTQSPGQQEPAPLDRDAAAGQRVEAACLQEGGSTDAWDPSLAQQRVTQLLHAVNSVLFERHGYAACNRYGVPRDAQLSSVMESGVGCSAALSILYLEVCSRLGVQMAAKPLEQGRYFVLWPTSQPIMADGQQFVVDPYGCGGLLLASEVCEMFDVEMSALWQPASRRQLLAALLGDLRDSYWARALGCNPNPSSMTPLSLATALDNKVGSINIHGLKRSLAAAEKRLGLLPQDRDAQLEFALLHYFSGHYDDAWIELGILLEKQQQHSQGATAQQQHQPSMSQPAEEPESGASADPSELARRPVSLSGPLDQEQPAPYSTSAASTTPLPCSGAPPSVEPTPSETPIAAAAAATHEVLLPTTRSLLTFAAQPLAVENAVLDAGSLGQQHSNTVGEVCWLPLSDEQLQQVRILMEKVRLMLLVT